MFSHEVLFLGLALAIDAAVVSFALGLLAVHLSKSEKINRGIAVTLCFGVFQFLMMWLGSFGGFLFAFSSYGYLSQFVVGAIFFLIAVKFFQESMNPEKKDLKWGALPLILLALATSIDALAAGISFGTLPNAYLSALEVGVITSFLCAGFYVMSQFLHHIPDRWLLRFAGLILTYLSFEIFWSQYARGIL